MPTLEPSVPQTGGKKIRVLLVDDHEAVREGLKLLLGSAPGLDIVGDARTMAQAVSEAARLKPDVVLLDIRLPDGSGFEACRRIRALEFPVRVLFLTAFGDDETVFEGISAGADGYLLKQIDSQHLVDAITNVAAGQSVLDPAVIKRVMGRVRSPSEPDTNRPLDALSPQEKRVIALVAEGKTNKEIALVLGLSDKTIKNHLSSILDKLKLTRRSQAAALFVQQTINRA